MPALAPRPVLALAALLVGAALAVALASEHWGGLVPCALCLLGRWPYWAALAAALPGLAVPRLAAWSLAGLGLAMLAGAGIGVVHVGVEAGWWPSPLPGCAARFTPGASIAEQLARMPERPPKPCDAPDYLVPGVPVSMAAMNLVFSLAMAGLAGAALWRGARNGVADGRATP